MINFTNAIKKDTIVKIVNSLIKEEKSILLTQQKSAILVKILISYTFYYQSQQSHQTN